MAFTQTPEASTHQTKRLAINGGQTISSNVSVGIAQGSSLLFGGQRYINCYPKRLELSNTDDQWVLTKCPPVVTESKTFTGSGTDPIRCVSSDGLYIWKGRRLYRNDLGTLTAIYTGTNDLYVKSMFRAVNPSSTEVLYCGIVRDNTTGTTHAYTYNINTNTYTQTASLTYLEQSQDTPYQSVYFNGRLFAIGAAGEIYNSAAGNYLSWSSTSFTVPEARGDALIAIVLYKNHLVAFSTTSIEFFYDAAIEIGSPLLRQESYQSLNGIKTAQNIAQTGDNIFFLSFEDRFGYGVYTFQDYSVKRISNFYVDTLLNNEDITADSTFLTRFYIVDFYGDPCLIFNTGFASALYMEDVYVNPVYVFQVSSTAGFPYIAYSTKQRQWFDFAFSTEAGYDWTLLPQDPGFMQLAPNNLDGVWKTYFVTAYSASGVVTWASFTKDYNSAYGSTAEIIFDTTDFGVFRWKHIKYVDALGDFGNNTISLAWSPNTSYSNWSNYVSRDQSALGYKNAIRYRNLGRHRTSAFKVRFAGDSNIQFKGLDVAYNLGTD